ncbi:hypothetical protein [Saccharospirillum salsuginis]|uniref:Uncharacterized protein n=1 Tax=Saccharospirillum salsuginis TaxID=418750 RepID=A0A918K5X1_9GAMM|nr:hypothetical protein [Saccharospirillum salsuginis]GGX49873.1 hypothetical protein GCM10007392_16580 [Saccharospirillum salsuginis]
MKSKYLVGSILFAVLVGCKEEIPDAENNTNDDSIKVEYPDCKTVYNTNGTSDSPIEFDVTQGCSYESTVPDEEGDSVYLNLLPGLYYIESRSGDGSPFLDIETYDLGEDRDREVYSGFFSNGLSGMSEIYVDQGEFLRLKITVSELSELYGGPDGFNGPYKYKLVFYGVSLPKRDFAWEGKWSVERTLTVTNGTCGDQFDWLDYTIYEEGGLEMDYRVADGTLFQKAPYDNYFFSETPLFALQSDGTIRPSQNSIRNRYYNLDELYRDESFSVEGKISAVDSSFQGEYKYEMTAIEFDEGQESTYRCTMEETFNGTRIE